ncbi:hypothetical protein [Sphingobacterium sp.]|uniref:hypothetical protein n=1 Tax=Sphingobacterium sp. TaxID=341027 RepID=UPI0031D10BC7
MKDPNKEFEIVIKDSDLTDLATNLGEIAIDSAMDDGILKDIPIIGSVINVIKFGNSLNRHFTIKKISKFLFQLQDIPPEKRLSKIEEINNSGEYQSSVGEMVMEILDRVESDGKPEMIGKLFAAFIKEDITFQEYLKFSHYIKSVYYYELLSLKHHNEEHNFFYGNNDGQLQGFGLTTNVIDEWGGGTAGPDATGSITQLGKDLVKYAMT